MKNFLVPVLLGAASIIAGCATTSVRWDDAGFHEDLYGWEVPYPAGQKKLIGADWQLDNYQYDTATGTQVQKEGKEYVAFVGDDENGDGKIDRFERQRVFLYNLKFVHARNNGVIWVQTFRVHPADAERDLDVVLANYADSLAGTGIYRQGSIFNTEVVKTRSFTVFVNDKSETKVGSYPALGALIELAETSRLQLNRADRSAKLRVVLSKFTYLEELHPGSIDPAPQARSIHLNGNVFKERVAVILIGYANDPEHFESGMGDFEAFRGRLRWPRPRPLPSSWTPKAAAKVGAPTDPSGTIAPTDATPSKAGPSTDAARAQ